MDLMLITDIKLWSFVENKEIPEMKSSVMFSLPALELHFFQTKFHTLLSRAHLPSLADLETQRMINKGNTFKLILMEKNLSLFDKN